MSRRSTSVGGAIALLLWLVATAGPVRADEPTTARAFKIRFHALADAADIVSPLLSDVGSITLRPRQATLVIEDRAEVMRRVATLLEDWDIPPQNVEFTLTLLLGTHPAADDDSAGGTSGELSQEVRGVLDMLGEVTRWTRYESLGSRSISGAEGESVWTELSDGYRVVFHVDAVHAPSKKVQIRLSLLQNDVGQPPGPDGGREIYSAAMTIPEGRVKIVGAAQRPDSEEALFLTLKASLR